MSLDEPTGGEPPPPPSPEYLAETRGPIISGVTWLAVALPLVVVSLRCYTRLHLRKVFGIDDWFICIAMVLLISYGGVVEAAVGLGFGRHVEWVMINAPQNAIKIALLGQVSQPLVIMSCAMGKTSFSISLMRVAAQRWIHVIIWFIIVSMNVLHILVSILLFFRCEDPQVLWDPSVQTTCWEPHVYLYFMYFVGSYSAATDFALALLPWFMLWNLNMKKKEKFGVALAMSLGIFAGATAVIKCTNLAVNTSSTDPTYDVGILLLWAGAENGLILLAASLPTLRPLLRAVFKSSTGGKDSDPSFPLKNMNNMNMFAPKAKAGEWSAIIETQADHNSDNQSDRSILKQSDGNEPGSRSGGHESSAERGVFGIDQTHHIKKTTSVNVTYERS